jgi:hypothetical protein
MVQRAFDSPLELYPKWEIKTGSGVSPDWNNQSNEMKSNMHRQQERRRNAFIKFSKPLLASIPPPQTCRPHAAPLSACRGVFPFHCMCCEWVGARTKLLACKVFCAARSLRFAPVAPLSLSKQSARNFNFPLPCGAHIERCAYCQNDNLASV